MRGLYILTTTKKKVSIEQIKENSYTYDVSVAPVANPRDLYSSELKDNIFTFKYMIKTIDNYSDFHILFPDNAGKCWIVQTFDSDGNPK